MRTFLLVKVAGPLLTALKPALAAVYLVSVQDAITGPAREAFDAAQILGGLIAMFVTFSQISGHSHQSTKAALAESIGLILAIEITIKAARAYAGV